MGVDVEAVYGVADGRSRHGSSGSHHGSGSSGVQVVVGWFRVCTSAYGSCWSRFKTSRGKTRVNLVNGGQMVSSVSSQSKLVRSRFVDQFRVGSNLSHSVSTI